MNLYIKIRNYDIYKGKNPFKIILHLIALKMWDYHEAKCNNHKFLNKNKTDINNISFIKYLILSWFYDSKEFR